MAKAKVKKKKAVKKSKPKAKTRKAVKKSKSTKPKGPKPVGKVTHFFGNLSVAIVVFSKDFPVDSTVRFKGATTDFVHLISEMQYDHKPVSKAKKGKEVGIKVKDKVREGDWVFEEI